MSAVERSSTLPANFENASSIPCLVRSSPKAKARPNPSANPSLIATLPDSSVRPFLTYVWSTPEVHIGIWFFEVSVKNTARHMQPLQKMPKAPLSFESRMQRRASALNAPDHKAMMAANQASLPRVQGVGGKIYPPFAPILSKEKGQR